jgi:hypothetical protein
VMYRSLMGNVNLFALCIDEWCSHYSLLAL